MSKNVKISNPMKGYHRYQHPLELRKRLGTEVHQRRHSQVQRKPYHP